MLITAGERKAAALLCLALQDFGIPADSFTGSQAKVPATPYIQNFNGTPFKNLLWRVLGVKIGRRVFDDGCSMTDRAMVTIGDGAILNMGSSLQAHSLDDGTFKSDCITLAEGGTVGTYALVHYRVTMGKDSVLDAHSFLMKGSDLPPGERWCGNPATPASAGAEADASAAEDQSKPEAQAA